MRLARTLTLLATAMIVVAAFNVTSASATDTVELVNEKTGTHCATSGVSVCTVHASGVVTLRVDLGIFGEAFEATCNLEVVGRVSESATGVVDAVNTSTGAGQEAGCPTVTTECSMPWPVSGEEDGPVGVVQGNAAVCIDPAESGSNCVGNLAFSVVEEAAENYEIQFNNASVGLCELDVDLQFEASDPGTADVHANHP